MSSDPSEKHFCANCGKESKFQCPKCIELNLSSYFCTQECFKNTYKAHNTFHKIASYKPPHFKYTGDLRPFYKNKTRKIIPNSISKPDYYDSIDGTPISEVKQGEKLSIVSSEQLESIRTACRLARAVLDIATNALSNNISTEYIDDLVTNACIKYSCYPSPLNYYNFPKSVCTSVNEVVCHGIPDYRQLQVGDIINIDVTVYYNGYHGDVSETHIVVDNNLSNDFNNIAVSEMKNPEKYNDNILLLKTAYESLKLAISKLKPGVPLSIVGNTIEPFVNKNHCSVVREYCGHGVGKLFHCNPVVKHYSTSKKNKTRELILQKGMIFTIEPMINRGTCNIKHWDFDDWTVVTADGKNSAQYEHTLLITDDGCEVLTARTKDSRPFIGFSE